MKKYLFPIITLVICFAVVGTTFAWLVDTTDTIENTFTVGDVDIELTEGANLDLKMVPGRSITKDPKVTVKSVSEKCWLFVEIKKVDFDTYMTFAIADGWTQLDGQSGVYYREVSDTNTDQEFGILKDNKVTVKTTITRTDLATAKTAQPKLKFTAYAVQSEGVATAAAAWSVATTGNLPNS